MINAFVYKLGKETFTQLSYNSFIDLVLSFKSFAQLQIWFFVTSSNIKESSGVTNVHGEKVHGVIVRK